MRSRADPGPLPAASDPPALRAWFALADAGARARLAATLQGTHGNAAVQRLAADAPLPVQRWRVGLPAGTTDCGRVVGYLNSHSPYRRDSGWARTRARFNWGGDPVFDDEGGTLSATVANPTVDKQVDVDMPEWSPSDAGMASAWSGMTADLRAHEARHEGIASDWEGYLRTDLETLTVHPGRRTLPAFRSAVKTEWDTWIADHQRDQLAIDPYTAVLDCSGPGEEEAPAE
jgi:hypothetical protein